MNPAAYILRAMVKGYQWVISPVLPASCRYYPTCSSYTLQAIETHGALKGGWMGLKRFGRCHPWNDGGYDPVPGTAEYAQYHDHHQHTHTHAHSSCGCSPDAKV